MRVCAHLYSFWTHRRHVRARVSLCILYVPITGHHVTCQDSRVQDEVVVFFFSSSPPPPPRLSQSRLIPGASSPSCAHLRSALRNDHRFGDGWMGGWTDGCGCRVESPSSVAVITSTFGLPPSCEEDTFISELFIIVISSPPEKREKAENGCARLKTRKVADHAYGNFRFRRDKVFLQHLQMFLEVVLLVCNV